MIGGAAGAIPPLAGWAAAHGAASGIGAVWLFAIVLLWTPPHFWALALLLERRATRPPMCRCCRWCAGRRRPRYRCSATRSPSPCSRSLPAALGTFGVVYLVTAVVLGLTLCALAVRLWRDATPAAASALFHFSLLYLALLFAAVAIDAAVAVVGAAWPDEAAPVGAARVRR